MYTDPSGHDGIKISYYNSLNSNLSFRDTMMSQVFAIDDVFFGGYAQKLTGNTAEGYDDYWQDTEHIKEFRNAYNYNKTSYDLSNIFIIMMDSTPGIKGTGEASETLTRRGAFRKAKRDAGIPNVSQHKKPVHVYDGTSENRWVYEFGEYTEKGYQKFIIEHREDKFGRGFHFHGADSSKGNPLQKGRYNQYGGHYPENFNGYKKP